MDIHSNDDKTGSTKLERINTLSAGDKAMVFNNLGHIIDLSLLRNRYHRLDRKKAVGIDGVTKEQYGRQLEENLVGLLKRIRRGTYRPQPARIVEIPKEDGSTRPLMISCLEDKIVQSAVNVILTKIYEPLFLPSSYGYRPNNSPHAALRALGKATYQHKDGAVVEIDLKKYFNSIPIGQLMECLAKKISDKRFLDLVHCLIRTPIQEGDQVTPNEIGCPQGSIISPILSNIYLHEVVDSWFEETRRKHLESKAELVRFCDDMVFIFQKKHDAEKFYRVLPKRLEKYGLNLHTEKTRLIDSGQYAAMRAEKAGKRLPTYQFLGFVCYWGKARKGFWRLKYTSRRDRFTAKLKGLREYLKKNLNTQNTPGLLIRVKQVLRGWINYHGVSDNSRRVRQFIHKSERTLFRWFNRRGRKRPMNWERFIRILEAISFPRTWKTVSMF